MTLLGKRSLHQKDLLMSFKSLGQKQENFIPHSIKGPIIKIALVANEPPPYRVPVFNRIAAYPDISFQVIFCCRREPNRFWNLPPMNFDHVYLNERIKTVDGRYIHNNPDVFEKLKTFSPDVVVTNGFNPTHLYAFAYASAKRLAYVPMTDGTLISEQALSGVHRMVRRLVYARADAYAYASLGGKKLYEDYGVNSQHCFQSHLCTDNAAFGTMRLEDDKRYDFIFCGRMEAGKNPLFALDVASEVAKRLGRKVSILFVGSGSQLEMIKKAAELRPDQVEAHFYGFAAQEKLPALYHSARVFLFPTLADVWGVVANEACAAGLPVIASTFAGVAGELVLHDQNGYICELDIELWAQRASDLLTQPQLWDRFSKHSLSLVDQYTFDAAAGGLADACRHAVKRRSPFLVASQ